MRIYKSSVPKTGNRQKPETVKTETIHHIRREQKEVDCKLYRHSIKRCDWERHRRGDLYENKITPYASKIGHSLKLRTIRSFTGILENQFDWIVKTTYASAPRHRARHGARGQFSKRMTIFYLGHIKLRQIQFQIHVVL